MGHYLDPGRPRHAAHHGCCNCIGTIALLVWRVGSAGLVGFAVLALLLLISTRVVRRMNQQEQQLKRQQDERNGILAEYIKKLRLVRQTARPFTRVANAKRQQELGCWAGCSGSMPSTKG